MTLCTNNLQTACSFGIIIQLDIRTTSCHVRCDRNRSMHTCICNDLSFFFMVFCIQHIMLDSFFFQHPAQQFGNFDGDRTNQYRLTGRMSFFNCFYNSPVFFLFRLIYRIFQVFSENRLIGRDLNNIHTINITELFFLSQGCTGHTTLLIILIK